MVDLQKGGETHSVSLTVSGTEYGFMLRSWPGYRKLDVSDFSPRVSSGSLGYRDLSLWQVWAQDSWHHGMGKPYATDEAGYHKTGHGVDTRHNGIATLATKVTSSETGKTVNKFLDFDGYTYAGLAANGGVRKYDDGWAATSQTTGTVLDMISTGDYLVATMDGGQTRKMGTDGTWSDAGLSTADDFRQLCLHGGALWASEDGANVLHFATETDLSDLEGTGDTEEIVVGPGSVPIVNMVSYMGVLYVARQDGLWIVDDTNAAYSQMDFRPESHSSNFASMCVWHGHLYFTVRNCIYRYTGSTLLDVTPPRYETVYPYRSWGSFKSLTPRGRFLYVTARNTEDDYEEHLMAYDGVGWHNLLDIVDTPYSMNTMGLSPNNDYLWLNYSGASAVTAYIPLQSLSDLPYGSFETSGNHYLYSSTHDAGFVDVDKAYSDLRVRTNNCSATQTVDVYYSIDDGAWTSLGTVNESPYQALTFDIDVYGKKIALRFNLATADSEQTPVLEATALKYLLRPDTIWGWQLPLRAADDERDLTGHRERTFTAKEKLAALEAARDSKTVCTFTDPWGADHYVFVTACNENGLSWQPGKNPEVMATVSLAEA